MALIDRIQQNLAAAGTEPVGTTDQTARARSLLAAKSGKALPTASSAPQSAVAESAAVDQTAQAMAPVQQTGQVAAANVGQQTQQLAATERGARADLDIRKQQMQQQSAIKKNQLLADLSRDKQSLNLDRDKAKLEQLAFTMRMGDKQYMDMLESEGTRRRLDNDIDFKEALQKSIMGSNTDLLKQSLKYNDILAADDRQFQEALSHIDINAAIQMANNERADARQAAMIQGAGGLATAAVSAYGNSKPSTTTTPAAAPANAGTTQAHGGPGSSDVAGSSWRSGY